MPLRPAPGGQARRGGRGTQVHARPKVCALGAPRDDATGRGGHAHARTRTHTHVCVCVSRSHMHARARTHARMRRACGTCSRCSPAVRLPLGTPCPHARAPQVGPRESERGCCTVARRSTPGGPPPADSCLTRVSRFRRAPSRPASRRTAWSRSKWRRRGWCAHPAGGGRGRGREGGGGGGPGA